MCETGRCAMIPYWIEIKGVSKKWNIYKYIYIQYLPDISSKNIPEYIRISVIGKTMMNHWMFSFTTTARSPRYAGDAAVQQDEELVQGLGRWGKWGNESPAKQKNKKHQTVLSKQWCCFEKIMGKIVAVKIIRPHWGFEWREGVTWTTKIAFICLKSLQLSIEPVCSTTVELWSGFPGPSFTWCFPHHTNIWTTGPDQLPTDARANWASQTGWLAVQLLLLPAGSNAEHRRTDFSDLQDPQFILL